MYAISYGFGYNFLWFLFGIIILSVFMVIFHKKKKSIKALIICGLLLILLYVVVSLKTSITKNYSELAKHNEIITEEKESDSNINSAVEVAYLDLFDLHGEIIDSIISETEKLNDVELYGASSNQLDKIKHSQSVYDKCIDKVMSESEIPRGQKVIISGYIGRIQELDEQTLARGAGNISFLILPNKYKDLSAENFDSDFYNSIHCLTNDKTFLEIQENTPVKIKGVFMKPNNFVGVNESLFDCKIVE